MNGLPTYPGNTPLIFYHAGINPIPILVLTVREAGLIFTMQESIPLGSLRSPSPFIKGEIVIPVSLLNRAIPVNSVKVPLGKGGFRGIENS